MTKGTMLLAAVPNAAERKLKLVRQRKMWVQYVRNLYEVIDRLRAKHPKLEIESCSGGGGRIDLGILQRVEEVWTSDNTEAFDRLRPTARQPATRHAEDAEETAQLLAKRDKERAAPVPDFACELAAKLDGGRKVA